MTNSIPLSHSVFQLSDEMISRLILSLFPIDPYRFHSHCNILFNNAFKASIPWLSQEVIDLVIFINEYSCGKVLIRDKMNKIE